MQFGVHLDDNNVESQFYIIDTKSLDVSLKWNAKLVVAWLLWAIVISLSKHTLTRFVCLFVALRPKSTAIVIAGRSVHLTTLFPGQA